MIIPESIDRQMWEALDQVSDETEELRLSSVWLLKYEGWSSVCLPVNLPENFCRAYAIRQSPKIHQEWNAKMQQRGYKPVLQDHDEHLGLYGVTYALYKKR